MDVAPPWRPLIRVSLTTGGRRSKMDSALLLIVDWTKTKGGTQESVPDSSAIPLIIAINSGVLSLDRQTREGFSEIEAVNIDISIFSLNFDVMISRKS